MRLHMLLHACQHAPLHRGLSSHVAPAARHMLKVTSDTFSARSALDQRIALHCSRMCVAQDELKSLMAIADVDGDGLIDYNEFVAATMHVSKLEKEELLQKVGVRV